MGTKTTGLRERSAPQGGKASSYRETHPPLFATIEDENFRPVTADSPPAYRYQVRVSYPGDRRLLSWPLLRDRRGNLISDVNLGYEPNPFVQGMTRLRDGVTFAEFRSFKEASLAAWSAYDHDEDWRAEVAIVETGAM